MCGGQCTSSHKPAFLVLFTGKELTNKAAPWGAQSEGAVGKMILETARQSQPMEIFAHFLYFQATFAALLSVPFKVNFGLELMEDAIFVVLALLLWLSKLCCVYAAGEDVNSINC